MSTTYYICRKQEYERSEAISSYTERIRQTLFSYLNASLSPKLKDDAQLMDDLKEAISPMCRELEYQINYSPEVRLCTVTRDRIIWHREEAAEAGFKGTDELVVIDEYGKNMSLDVFLASVGVTKTN